MNEYTGSNITFSRDGGHRTADRSERSKGGVREVKNGEFSDVT
jgi:hypothetical protein